VTQKLGYITFNSTYTGRQHNIQSHKSDNCKSNKPNMTTPMTRHRVALTSRS